MQQLLLWCKPLKLSSRWVNLRSFGFRLFSLTSSAIDHSAIVPPNRHGSLLRKAHSTFSLADGQHVLALRRRRQGQRPRQAAPLTQVQFRWGRWKRIRPVMGVIFTPIFKVFKDLVMSCFYLLVRLKWQRWQLKWSSIGPPFRRSWVRIPLWTATKTRPRYATWFL